MLDPRLGIRQLNLGNKIGMNTQMNPWYLKRLEVTQTPVKDPQLELVWKTHKAGNNNNN